MLSKTNKKKRYIAAIIICLLLSAAILFIVFFVTNLFEETILYAVEHEATFERTEQTEKGYLIYVYEYPCKLMLNSGAIIDVDYLLELEEGATVFFRIPISAENFINDLSVKQLAVVTFKSQKDIISFDSFNKFERNQITNGKITGMVFASIFILVALYFVLKLNGVVLFKGSSRTKTTVD